MEEGLDLVRRLLGELIADEGKVLPTSALGRLRRTANAAIRVGTSAVLDRALGRSGGDVKRAGRLVLSLGELKGIAMKVGQILSYMDTGLPEEVRAQLALLQTHSQPTAFRDIEDILRADFGTQGSALLETLERKPVATASIGQVHRARLPDGTPVAVKVRHPGIDVAIRADLRAASTGKVLARLLAPGVDVAEFLEEARSRFLEECDYVLEREHQERFGELYRNSTEVSIPAVHPAWCSPRVLTSTWHEGSSLDDFARSSTQAARDRAGEALYEFYLGTLYRHGLFNADPHPGNLMFSPEGAVTVLDHGCVRAFDSSAVPALARLSVAVLKDEAEGIRSALASLGVRRPEASGFDVTRRLLRAFYAPILEPGSRPMNAEVALDMRRMVEDKRSMLQLQLPGKLLFLLRIRFGLYAVLARVGAVLDWHALEDQYIGKIAAETVR